MNEPLHNNHVERAQHDQAIRDAAMPCPLCGSNNLSLGFWCLDDEDVEALECNQCHAGAPIETWQRRDRGWINIERPPKPHHDVIVLVTAKDGAPPWKDLGSYNAAAGQWELSGHTDSRTIRFLMWHPLPATPEKVAL